jgi:hypothetical protein
LSSDAAEQPPGPSRRALAILFAAVLFLHCIVTGGHLTSPDEELMFRTAESIALRGSTSILPIEYDESTGQLLVPPGATFATRQGVRGRFFAQYPLLQPLLTAPLVWIAHATDGIFAESFARVCWPTMAHVYHDKSPPEYYHRGLVAMFFNPLIAALSALVLARLGAFLTKSNTAGIGAAILWAFTTIAWAHSRTYFTEPLAALLGLIATGALLRWHFEDDPKKNRRHLICFTVALAAGVWARVDFPIIAAGLLTTFAFFAIQRRSGDGSRARFTAVAICGAAVALSFALLQFVNHSRYGGVDLTSGYADQSEGVKFSTPILVGLHGLIASPGKGLFFFSPGLIIGIWGWCVGGPRIRAAALCALAAWLPFFIAMAMWQNWDGGWCWGPRHIVQIHLPIMLGAAFLLAKPMGVVAKSGVRLFAAAGAIVQLFASTQCALDYYTEYYNTPKDGVYYRQPYRERELMLAASLLKTTDRATGVEVSPATMPAPLVDSLYVPQNTQWAAYPEMFQAGYLDLFFVRAIFDVPAPPDRWGGAK